MDFSAYKNFLKKEYPSTSEILENNSLKIPLFSETVYLPSSAFQQMKKVIQLLFQLRSRSDYKKNLSIGTIETALKEQKQDSVLMAYDFHLQDEIPKLIEVNTNASSFLLANSFYQFKDLPYEQAKEDLKQSFQSEWEKFKGDKTNPKPQKVVLIDEEPLKQKMMIEFFMYKDFFQSMDWSFEIQDSQSLKIDDKGFLYTPKGDKIDFIYNRSTDFYFKNHPHLAKAYLKGTCAISPNPREYYLLSDKNRLCEWSAQKNKWSELEQIKQNIPFSEVLSSSNKEETWNQRKKYFFKIAQGYSGKLAYRGAGLTHKKFNELYNLKSLVQEFIPPSSFKDNQGKEWKIDFRVYVYRDKIQQFVARCYQGQLTNFKQEGSGFATVKLTE